MASRTTQTEAIIFSVKPQGENNSTVRLFTKEGLIYATLYGGPKSRLRPRVSLWNSGMVWLYKNEQNGSVKISDFDVKNYHLSFRTDLYKNFAASLASEIAIKTNCAGSEEKCFRLVSGFLDGLEIADNFQAHSGLVRFLWRYLALLGLQPEAEACVLCGKNIACGGSMGAAYERTENGFVCQECFVSHGYGSPAQFYDSHFYASGEAAKYLAAVTDMKASEVRSLPLSSKAQAELKRLLLFLTENACAAKLKTLQSAGGLL